VIVWDRGTWEAVGDARAGYRAGKLKFQLHGEKLHGRWNLVRMRPRAGERRESWLLIKEDDEEARPSADYDVVEAEPDSVITGNSVEAPKARTPLPLAFSPQLATLVQEVPTGPGWIYEVKFDGYRILARVEGKDVRLFTRNGNDWTAKMPRLAEAVGALGIASAWIDGEVVVLDEKGNPDFQRLQNAFDASRTAGLVYFVFDLPYFDGHDLRREPLVERRRLLEAAIAGRQSAHVRFSSHVEGAGARLLASACRRGLEGLIGKRADAPYSSRRTNAWIKLKCTRRQEFVIAGYTDPRGSRKGFGSLLLGVHDEHGSLVYAGNVGTGFDHAGLDALHAKLGKIATERSPFKPLPRGVKGHWVRPSLVAEVSFTEWTSDGRIRHPVFHGLRTDKDPRAITREPVRKPPRARTRSARHRAR
jgi:bifunctional non-homologous end joining protein LigD